MEKGQAISGSGSNYNEFLQVNSKAPLLRRRTSKKRPNVVLYIERHFCNTKHIFIERISQASG